MIVCGARLALYCLVPRATASYIDRVVLMRPHYTERRFRSTCASETYIQLLAYTEQFFCCNFQAVTLTELEWM
jgi:hypothetical protein